MRSMQWMRDPTAETSPLKRPRREPPKSLAGLTVGLFDIGKTRSNEFLDQVELRLNERNVKTKRLCSSCRTRYRTVPRMN